MTPDMDGHFSDNDVLHQHRVSAFLTQEARLLDDRRFEEWLALFAEDGRYWVPLTWEQADWVEHVSLINEDVRLLKMRIRRLLDPRTASQFPPSRTAHQVTDTIVMGSGPGPGDLWTRSSFTMVEYRRSEQRWFAGFVTHNLRTADGSFRILLKRVDLLNCDSDSGHLRFAIPF